MRQPKNTKPETSWRALAAWVLVMGVIPIGLLLLNRWEAARLPDVPLTGLDSAVAQKIESALKEVRTSPRSAAGWGRLGATLMHYEFPMETRVAFTEAERLDAHNPRWPHLHGLAVSATDIASATELFRRATALAGGSPDAPRLHFALALSERGLGSEAETEFQALLRQTPSHPVAALGLARIRAANGQFTDATNLLQRCLANPHIRRAAHTLLATAEKALGNHSAATVAARTAASLPTDAPWPDPWWTDALTHRVGRKALLEDATTLLDRGNPAGTLELLGRVTNIDPSDAEARYLSGWALNQLGRYDEAERELRLHLQLARDSAKGHAQLAVALLSQKRPADAAPVLETAIALKPTWRELRSNLGFALVQMGRNGEALAQFREALALDPNYLPTYTALAELLSRSGGRTEALQLLRQAAELAPDDARIQAALLKLWK